MPMEQFHLGIDIPDMIIGWWDHNFSLWPKAKSKGWRTEKGYIKLWYRGKKEYFHKLVWEAWNGPVPKGYCIHHLNGIVDDNRIQNLVCLSKEDHDNYHKELKYYDS